LSNAASLALVAQEIERHQPVLVIIDPLYLAAGGARGSDLYEMGALLEGVQVVCQQHGSALIIAHHWNKTGEGRGAKRMSGAGPDAWGRFLISAAVVRSDTDPDSLCSSVILDIDFQGDEIAEQQTRIRRKVWTDDPNDLSSPMHYEVTVMVADPGQRPDGHDGLKPASVRVLAVLNGSDQWWTVRGIGDVLANDSTGGLPLKVRTIQDALKQLIDAELAESKGVLGGLPGQWRSIHAQRECGDENAL
jgi:hypothetical protein